MHPGSALQVLIVDDDQNLATGTGELVRLLGHDAFVANSGVGGLEIAMNRPVDVALLDLEMPGMDGHEVARRLLRLRRPGLYIVAVTGRGSEDDMQESASSGFIEHVVKPCGVKALTEVFARAANSLAKQRKVSPLWPLSPMAPIH